MAPGACARRYASSCGAMRRSRKCAPAPRTRAETARRWSPCETPDEENSLSEGDGASPDEKSAARPRCSGLSSMPLGNVSLTPQLVRAVRDAVDIVAIASEHTRLRKAGRRYQGLCPLHKEKTPSFSVDPVQGLFYCFGCGAGGDAIKLHMLATGDDFPAAIEARAQRYALPRRSRAVRAAGAPERDLEGALAAATRFSADQLRRPATAQGYLPGRRVSA